ncbi:hypothetical protein M2122_000858 [Polynucleobacter sphagniphilus]|nr:hypothetical protein [Polynucleobacter sphagniphilus]
MKSVYDIGGMPGFYIYELIIVCFEIPLNYYESPAKPYKI